MKNIAIPLLIVLAIIAIIVILQIYSISLFAITGEVVPIEQPAAYDYSRIAITVILLSAVILLISFVRSSRKHRRPYISRRRRSRIRLK